MNVTLIKKLVDKEIQRIWDKVENSDIKPDVAHYKLKYFNLDEKLKELNVLRKELNKIGDLI